MATGRRAVQGYVALKQGTTEEISCPVCKAHPVVYNGNYFCDNWDFPKSSGRCDWALPHPAVRKRDRKICDLIGIDYG